MFIGNRDCMILGNLFIRWEGGIFIIRNVEEKVFFYYWKFGFWDGQSWGGIGILFNIEMVFVKEWCWVDWGLIEFLYLLGYKFRRMSYGVKECQWLLSG